MADTRAARRVRLGVVGLGLVGQVVHLPNLARLGDGFEITHLSDLSRSRMATAAEALGGRPSCSVDASDLFSDPAVDAVLLLTTGAHGPLAEQALRADKHVLSEKPLCITQAEAARLGALARERGLVMQVAYMKAYDPAISPAREAVGTIGDVKLIEIEVRHPSTENQVARLGLRQPDDVPSAVHRALEAQESERSRDALGAVPPGLDRLYRLILLGSIVHELAAVRALGFAVPRRWEHALAWPFDPHDAAAEPPSIAATAILDGGTVLRLQWLWLPDYPRYEETISVVGALGAVTLEMPQPYGPNVPARWRVRGTDGVERLMDDGRQWRDSGFLAELRSFHAAITDGGPNPTGADVARADTASLQALAALIAHEHGLQVGGEAEALR